MAYEGKLKTRLYWWLVKGRSFVINGEYQIDLLFIDKEQLSAKILVTNLKDGSQEEQDIESFNDDNEMI